MVPQRSFARAAEAKRCGDHVHYEGVVPTYGIRLYYHVIRRHQSVSCQNIGLSACMISRIAVSRLWSEYNPG